MDRCGLKDPKNARMIIEADLDSLNLMQVSFRGKAAGGRGNYEVVNLFEKRGIKNGIIYADLTPTFRELLNDCPVMFLPSIIWKLNPKKSGYYILRKICEQLRMNKVKPVSNGGKIKEIEHDSITLNVKTLLKHAPTIATRKETQEKLRCNMGRYVIEPLTAELDSLSDVIKWEWAKPTVNGKPGGPVTEADFKNFDTFEALNVKITPIDYPDLEALKENKKKFDEKKQREVRRRDKAAADNAASR